MSNEFEVLEAVARQFGSKIDQGSREELFDEVVSIMKDFKILLVVDNLETIDRASLRNLLVRIPSGSKVLFTSRLGIQELELRYSLDPMMPKDAVRLTRVMGSLLNTRELINRNDSSITDICRKLYFNPLAIRWFVQSYADGKSIRQLTDRSRDLKEVLLFCFENLYDDLDAQYQKIVCILSSLSPLSEVQLAVISEIQDIEYIRIALQFLYASNLVRRGKDDLSGGESVLWTTTEFAKGFIQTHAPVEAAMRNRWQDTYRTLIRDRDSGLLDIAQNRFSADSFEVSSTDEATVAPILRAALRARFSDPKAASVLVDRAKALMPEYFEVYRVAARLAADAGDLIGARNYLDIAIDIAEGRSETLPLFYAQFLIQQEDFHSAVLILKEPAEGPNAAQELVSLYALSLMRSGEFEQAVREYTRAHSGLSLLGLKQRMVFMTQYAESVRRLVEVEWRRGLRDIALKYSVQSLEIVQQACQMAQPDSYLVNTANKCVGEFCSLVGAECDRETWLSHESLIVEIRRAIGGPFTSQGAQNLVVRCPNLLSRDVVLFLFGNRE